MEQLFGHDKRIQTILELSSDSCGSHRTATESGCVTRNKESILRNVVERSKETGTWISDISSIVGKVIGVSQGTVPGFTLEISSPAKKKTLKAIENARKGRDITSCNTFEDYLKAVAE